MTAIPVTDLFTPAPSGVTPGSGAPPPAGSWLAQELTNAATVGLSTTSWQSGGITRTILAIDANQMAQQDTIIAGLAMAGFLDYAANGTVQYTALNGVVVTTYVTPDPTVPSQWPAAWTVWQPGWLDALASSTYNCQRIGAVAASGPIAITNTTASTYNYAAGTYHVTNPTNGATYSNASALTIAAANIVGGTITAASNTGPIAITTSGNHGLASGQVVTIAGVVGNTAANGTFAITVTGLTTFTLNGSTGSGVYSSGGTVNVCTVATFNADLAGPGGTSGPGTITATITQNTGVTVFNVAALTGAPFETNTALANRCRLKLQSLSPNGPAGAYIYFALTAATILLAQTPSVPLSSPITRAINSVSVTTGVVTTIVASAAGAVPGCTNIAIIGATNASPIVVQTGAAHNLAGQPAPIYVKVTGVQGNPAANGTWQASVVDGTHLTLIGSAGNGAYTTGGVLEGGDLGMVDATIQANVVPDGISAVTTSATTLNLAIAATVYVPAAYAASYSAAVQTALALYVASPTTMPIGGVVLPGAANGVVPIDQVSGILYAAGIQAGGTASIVQAVENLTLNAGTVDITLSSTQVPVLSPAPVITVVGI